MTELAYVMLLKLNQFKAPKVDLAYSHLLSQVFEKADWRWIFVHSRNCSYYQISQVATFPVPVRSSGQRLVLPAGMPGIRCLGSF